MCSSDLTDDDSVVSEATDTDADDPIEADVDDDIEAADHEATDGANNAVAKDDYADFETAEMLADESFDRAFTSFMGNDLGAEPSRDWMINGE